MAIQSGFFNSINGDRRYDAKWFAQYFATFIGNGVFPQPSFGLQVMADTQMRTIVKAGKGWINGYFIINDSDHILTHERADGALKRIDRIVMQLDHQKRTIEIVIKKGAFASTPIAPTLVRNGDLYELALADVLINNGATQITQANITDQRLNKSLCGIVHGLVEQVDTTTIFNQYQAWLEEYKGINAAEWEAWQNQEKADFEAWFDSVKDILDGNVATKLAAQIATVDDKLNQHIAQDNAHGIGDKTTLATPDKTTIVGAINSHVVDYIKHPGYAVTTGKNAYNVTLNPKPSTLSEGFGIVIKVGANATDNCTLNVNGMGAKAIMSSDNRQITDLSAGVVYTLRYNGTSFILQGRGGEPVRFRDKIITMPGLVDIDPGQYGPYRSQNPASSDATYYFYDAFDRGDPFSYVATRDKKTLKTIARGNGNILSPFDAVYAPVFGDNVVMCAGEYEKYRQLHLVDATLRVVKIIDTLTDRQTYTHVSKAEGLLYASVYDSSNYSVWTNVYDQNGTLIKKLINKQGYVTIYDGALWMINYYNDRCRVNAVNTNDYRDFARDYRYQNNAVLRDGILYIDAGNTGIYAKAYDMTTKQIVATGVLGAVIGLKSMYGILPGSRGISRFKLGSMVKVTPDDEFSIQGVCMSYLHRPFGSNTELLLASGRASQLGIDTGVTE